MHKLPISTIVAFAGLLLALSSTATAAGTKEGAAVVKRGSCSVAST